VLVEHNCSACAYPCGRIASVAVGPSVLGCRFGLFRAALRRLRRLPDQRIADVQLSFPATSSRLLIDAGVMHSL